jgi:hypothetical protein
MEAVLCDGSALRYWRTHVDTRVSVTGSGTRLPKRRAHLNVDAPSAATVRDLRDLRLCGDETVCLLVGDSSSKHRLKGARVRIISHELPSRSVVRVGGEVYVVAPELLFLMAAERLSLVELLELGHELCGTYRMTDPMPTYGVGPLTRVSSIKSYALKAEGISGRRRALLACQYLADGSGSPAESTLSIMFRLPLRYGGYGLGDPLLNHEIELNEGASRLLGGQRTIRPDFFWRRAHYPVEYDSTLYHSTKEENDADERRRNAFAALGMGVTVVRPRHLQDIALLDEIAASIRKNIGLYVSRLPANYQETHRKLFEEACRFWIAARKRSLSERSYVLEAAAYSQPYYPW